MSSDKQAVDEPVADEPAADNGDGGEDLGDARQPSWWHRDHPTFAALSGFFTGLLFVALVPAAFFGVLSLALRQRPGRGPVPVRAGDAGRPVVLVASQRTRRFGTYFWIGMVLTAIVVVGVGALVLWYLVEHQN